MCSSDLNAPSETAIRLAGAKLEGHFSRRVEELFFFRTQLFRDFCRFARHSRNRIVVRDPYHLHSADGSAERFHHTLKTGVDEKIARCDFLNVAHRHFVFRRMAEVCGRDRFNAV